MASWFDLTEGREFMLGKVKPWLEGFVCDIAPPALVMPMLLSGIYLKLVELVAQQQGAGFFDIKPVNLATAGTAEQILDVDSNGRIRDVSLWVDSSVGGPAPTIRISKDASGSGGGGIRVNPGEVSELGRIPANVKLFASSDTAGVAMYLIIRS